jgi:predicted MFS family arabinose efflux permease
MDQSAQGVTPNATDSRKTLRGHGVLLLLTLVSLIANIDRNILAILQESIKHELHLSDAQLGLLTGFAFALFYSVFGLPLGRIADRWSRRDLIAISMTIWSAMTALTGLAHGFIYLLVARFGVGFGEAGCNPPSFSLISDYYKPRHRSAAFGFYYVSSYLGLLFGFLVGGWLDRVIGWRMAFLIIGAPGILVALLVHRLVGEPPRTAPAAGIRSMLDALRYMATQKAFRRLMPAVAINAVVPFGLIIWSAPLFIRVFHMTVVQAGTSLALTLGIGGMCGVFGAGLLGNLLAVRDARWYLWVCAIVALVDTVLMVGAFQARDATTTLLLLLFPFTFSAIYGTMSLSVINGTMPADLRATASATFLLIANLTGQGLGVWLIGSVSDAFKAGYGTASIQHAMLAVIPTASVVAAVIYLYAAAAVNRRLSDWR